MTNARRGRHLWAFASVAFLCAGTTLAGGQARGATIDCDASSGLAEPAGWAEACGGPEREPKPGDVRPPGHQPFAATSFAFAHDIGPLTNNVVRHRLNDFPGQVVLGPNTRLLFGLDFDPHAKTLYALDSTNNQLGTLSQTSGAFTLIGASTPLAGHYWSSLTIHPRTGKAYATSQGLAPALYTLNLKTGAATLVDPIDEATLIVAASLNCDGVMYVHDISRDSIFRVNTKNGKSTFVGATGVNSNFAQGMDFDNGTNTLYAWTYQGDDENQYGMINLKTGDLKPLASSDPEGEFEGATQTTCPPPNTTITKKPAKRTDKRKAEFRFVSSFAGSTFQCRLDRKPFGRCTSPFRRTLKPGRHTFRVRSIDPVGNTDRSPASYSWTVTR